MWDVTQLVPNVHELPGHIACDSASNAEVGIPRTTRIATQSPHIGRIDHTTLTLRGVCADCLAKQG